MSKEQVPYKDHNYIQRPTPYGIPGESNYYGNYNGKNFRGVDLKDGNGGIGGVGYGYGNLYNDYHSYGMHNQYNNSQGYPQSMWHDQYQGYNNNSYYNSNSDYGRYGQEEYYRRGIHPEVWGQTTSPYGYQYDQKLGNGEYSGGGIVGNQKLSKFSNGSNKWDRSNSKKVQQNTALGIASGNDNLEVDRNLNSNACTSDDSKVINLTDKQVELGVRVTSSHLAKKEASDNSSISVFHISGNNSIWEKIELLNNKKLCYECQKSKWRDKITPLCNNCYTILSSSRASGGSKSHRRECVYCKIEFLQHRILKKAMKVFGKILCIECCRNLCKYNTDPIRCHFCDCWSAWSSNSLCDRCTLSREAYGDPLPCDMCRKTCAFNRGEESKKKVDGRLFCFLCTIKYKKLKHDEVKKTNSIYSKAEKDLIKARSDKKGDSELLNGDSKVSNGTGNDNNDSATSEKNENIDWKLVAEERGSLYEKAKQHLTEIKSKELSDKIETGSIISKLKETNLALEQRNKQLEDTILHLNAKLNDWEIKVNNIYEEKHKQIKELKDEKKRMLEEMQDIIENLKYENQKLRNSTTVNSE